MTGLIDHTACVKREASARSHSISNFTRQTAAMPSSAFERLLDAQAEEMLASMERIKERRRTQAAQQPPSALCTDAALPAAARAPPAASGATPRGSRSTTPRTRADGSPRPTPGYCAPTLQSSKNTPYSPPYSPRPPSTPQTRASVAETRAARLWQVVEP